MFELIIEEDIFSLLRALSLFGCSTDTIGIRILDEIISTIGSLGINRDYIHALQRRTLSDVLVFFQV